MNLILSMITMTAMTLSLMTSTAFAQNANLVERVVEGTSKEKNAISARKEIIEKANEEITKALVIEMIGEAKYNRNRSVITQKVTRNFNRFTPYVKNGELEQLPDGTFKLSTVARVNMNDLQALLLENGLLYETDGTPSAIPFVKVVDKVNGRSYVWWTEKETSADALTIKQEKVFEELLKDALYKKNFYSQRPGTNRLFELLPSAYQSENLRGEDLQTLSEKLGAQIVVQGEIQLASHRERSDAYAINISLTALQVSNNRVIAEVVREFETDAGSFETVVDRRFKQAVQSTCQDLAAQVLDAWQKGTIGASLYKVTIRGRLPAQLQEAFKDQLKTKVREIKTVRERLISSDGIIFEVDSSVGPAEIAKKAASLEVGGLKLVVDSFNEAGTQYRIEKK